MLYNTKKYSLFVFPACMRCAASKSVRSIFLCASILFYAMGFAQAQDLPGSVDPVRVQDRLIPPQALPQTKTPDFLPPEDQEDLSAPAPASDGFVLEALDIEGSTAIDPQELFSIYESYIGEKTNYEIVKYIADKITLLYRKKGYFLSRAIVPEQDIQNGRVKIVVVEGYISDIRIQGNAADAILKKDYFQLFQKITEKIRASRPIHGAELERQLLLMKDLPGMNVHAVMEAITYKEAAPGAVGMVITIDYAPPSFTAAVDNFGSRFAGPIQLATGASFNNVVSAFDTVSLNVAAALPLSEVKTVAASYTLPVSSFGTSIGFQAGYSDLVPGYTLEQFEVESTSYNTSLSVMQRIIRSRQQNFSVSAVFDTVNVTSDYLGAELYDDRIRSLRISGLYDRSDSWNGVSAGNFTLSQGLDILGARETGSFNLSRATGHSDYTKIELDVSRLQQIGSVWQLYGAFSGQYAWDPLLSSEEFGYGGYSFGRAYDPSEITGDHGVSASLEMRYQGVPAWEDVIFEPFFFYDIGKVWKPDAARADQIVSGASAGAGLKFFYDNKITGSFMAAVPLTRPASDPPGYTKEDGVRFLFRISSEF
jgi:hemolysin activation/secretion protein